MISVRGPTKPETGFGTGQSRPEWLTDYRAPAFHSLGHIPGQRADFKVIVTDLANRGHLGRCAGQPALFKAFQLFWHYVPLDHLDAAIFQHVDHRRPRDSRQKAIGIWRVQPRHL